MKKVAILYHPRKEAAVKLAGKIKTFLRNKGIDAWSGSSWESEAARCNIEGSDLVISIGGDGTILRAAQCIVPAEIPITGINLGHLGFMTELTVAEVKKQLTRLIAGEGWIDERSLLEADLRKPGGKRATKYYALNDVVMARGQVVRVVSVAAKIDGKLLTTYKADGVIVSTATGSTGYALAAGGTILPPQAKEMLLLPIMPHLSSGFRLVVPSASTIELKLSTMYPATLSIDGHINPTIENEAVVTVKRSKYTARFLRIHPKDDFYLTLEKRLMLEHQ